MVFSNRFVMVLLVDGKTVDARKDGIVPIPFNQEYGLRFRNKHSRRAVVKFAIDGEDVSGPGYIIPAHDSVDILRHYHKDAKFKFVGLDTAEAAEYGKNDGNVDGSKGVIEVKFYLERVPPPPPKVVHHYHDHYYPYPYPYPVYPKPFQPYQKFPVWTNHAGPLYRSRSGEATCSTGGNVNMTCGSAGGELNEAKSLIEGGLKMGDCHVPPPGVASLQSLQEGCTVEGGYSGQSFRTVDIELETDFVTMVMVLRGYNRPAYSTSSVLTDSTELSHCTQCGAKRSRKSDKFCGACGNKF